MNILNVLDKFYYGIFSCRHILHPVEKQWHAIKHECNETLPLIPKYCTSKDVISSDLEFACGCKYNGCNDHLNTAATEIYFQANLSHFGPKTSPKGSCIQMTGKVYRWYVWTVRLILLMNLRLVKCIGISSDIETQMQCTICFRWWMILT
jgi:hypothetical protein